MKNCLRLIIILLVVFFSPGCYAFSLWWSSDPDQAFWYDLRRSFQMNHYVYNQAVAERIYWYQHHQKYLENDLKNAEPYLYYIYTQVIQHQLPGEFVLLPIIESDYDPFAYSNKGAAGLWQLMPGTASGYGLKEDWWYDGRRDIYASTSAALNHILYLKNFFNGNWLYVLAAYDWGDSRVQRAIQNNARMGYDTSFWHLTVPRETEAYVPRLLALAAIISNPEYYGIKLPPVKDAPYFAVVFLQKQIDLVKAAKFAGISLVEMERLNPGFNRWATDPNGPFRILLPIENITEFKQNIASGSSTTDRTVWQRYRVRNGDSLEAIAANFNTSVAVLQKINNLNTNLVWPGQLIYIPIDTNNLSYYPLSSATSSINDQPSPSINTTTNTQEVAPTNNPEPKKIVEIVRIGDSVWKFAKKYNLNADSIRSWNHLQPHQPLTVGQSLTFWQPSELHLAATQPSEIVKIEPKVIEKSIKLKKQHHQQLTKVHYKIKPKDTVYKISKQFGVSTKQLQKWNNIKQNKLGIGETLIIYKKFHH